MHDLIAYAIMICIPAAAGAIGGTWAARRAYYKIHKETTGLGRELIENTKQLQATTTLFTEAREAHNKATAQYRSLQKTIEKQVRLESRKKVVTHKLVQEIDKLAAIKAQELRAKEKGKNEI